MKEQTRIKREEDEMLKIMRAERRRQKLRNSHLHAWQHVRMFSNYFAYFVFMVKHQRTKSVQVVLVLGVGWMNVGK